MFPFSLKLAVSIRFFQRDASTLHQISDFNFGVLPFPTQKPILSFSIQTEALLAESKFVIFLFLVIPIYKQQMSKVEF